MNELSMNEQVANTTASWRVFDDITYKYVLLSKRRNIFFLCIEKSKQVQLVIIHRNSAIRVVRQELQLNHMLLWLYVEDLLVNNSFSSIKTKIFPSIAFLYKKSGSGANDVKYTVIIQNLPKHTSKLKEVRK
jgi:hypothetical protein